MQDTIKGMSLANEKKLEKVTQSFFSNVRDLVITEIFIDNGHRAGVLSNMTIHEYKKAKSCLVLMLNIVSPSTNTKKPEQDPLELCYRQSCTAGSKFMQTTVHLW